MPLAAGEASDLVRQVVKGRDDTADLVLRFAVLPRFEQAPQAHRPFWPVVAGMYIDAASAEHVRVDEGKIVVDDAEPFGEQSKTLLQLADARGRPLETDQRRQDR